MNDSKSVEVEDYSCTCGEGPTTADEVLERWPQPLPCGHGVEWTVKS